MVIEYLAPNDAFYPNGLQSSSFNGTFGMLATLGNQKVLSTKAIGFFASTKCPGDVILQTYNLAQQLRESGVPTISGFHSSMEQECLRILLRGSQPVVICPARSLEAMRIPAEWKKGIESGRLLLVSAFQGEKRATAKLAESRNRLVAGLADKILVLHAAPGSKTELLCREIAGHCPLLTLESDSNANLFHLGAAPIKIPDVPQLLKVSRPAAHYSWKRQN
ncbi:MAG: DNA-processing protein DprA [Acidobacteria bacterium]|nr:DNA-processing protein DprA [Acidobacteriota bacterium]MCI0724181.1 DNA-processing protein DprA [Acidobacteriota bacterium]